MAADLTVQYADGVLARIEDAYAACQAASEARGAPGRLQDLGRGAMDRHRELGVLLGELCELRRSVGGEDWATCELLIGALRGARSALLPLFRFWTGDAKTSGGDQVGARGSRVGAKGSRRELGGYDRKQGSSGFFVLNVCHRRRAGLEEVTAKAYELVEGLSEGAAKYHYVIGPEEWSWREVCEYLKTGERFDARVDLFRGIWDLYLLFEKAPDFLKEASSVYRFYSKASPGEPVEVLRVGTIPGLPADVLRRGEYWLPWQRTFLFAGRPDLSRVRLEVQGVGCVEAEVLAKGGIVRGLNVA